MRPPWPSMTKSFFCFIAGSFPHIGGGFSLPVIRLRGAGDGQLAVQEILGGFSVYRQLFSLAAEGQPVQALGE